MGKFEGKDKKKALKICKFTKVFSSVSFKPRGRLVSTAKMAKTVNGIKRFCRKGRMAFGSMLTIQKTGIRILKENDE